MMKNLQYLRDFHDLTLPAWGPYSKKFFGISHLSDPETGMRFDFTVVPAVYRRQLGIPDVLRPSGYLPWSGSPDLETYGYRQQLEAKDRLYADIRFAKLTDSMRLVECRCENRSDQPTAFGVHFLSMLVAPPEKHWVPVLPQGVTWIDALDHVGLEWANPRPQDNLVYDALRRGEVRLTGAVRGGCVGQNWGADAGDRLSFRLPESVTGPVELAIRCRVDGGGAVELLIDGVTVCAAGNGEWELLTFELPAGTSDVLTLISQGGGECKIDGIAVGKGAGRTEFVEAQMGTTPVISAGPVANSRIVSYDSVAPVYGVWWSFDSDFVRHYRATSMIDLLLYNDEVHQPFFGPQALHGGDEEWVDAVMQPLPVAPGGSAVVHAVVCSGSRAEVEASLRQASERAAEFPGVAEASLADDFSAPTTAAGEAFRFSRKRLAAVTLTNVVYPTYFKGRSVRHHTPGRRWNCLYTWDSGFIGLGLLEIGTRLAAENLNAYLTEPEDDECAFIHHGSPVPVQFYQFAELLNRTGDRKLAECFYPKLRHYYRFMAGHAASSTMRGKKRDTMIRSWDYFYNSGGWDDYPPQIHIHKHHLRDTIPAVGTSHVIRAAKILRTVAEELGKVEDFAMYNADVASLSGLLQGASWDAEAETFSYVRHDAEDRPAGILRHESGVNFDLGLDGASPLLAGICTEEQKKALWERLENPAHCWTDFGLSTVDRSAPYYRNDGYWNGSIWMPHQWFFWKAALDDGRADFAWRIAHTALSVYEREVADSYGCYEHITIAAGRGGGWHHFSALSCPVLCWFGAYFAPGRLTGGLDTVIRELSVKEREWSASVAIGGRPEEGVSTLVAVTVAGEWSAEYDGASYPVRNRVDGTVEIDLPRGTSGKLFLHRLR